MTTMIERLNAALEGRYRIESELGEGGMATVYLARDLKHERRVALKVLRPELAAVVGAERFLAEIKTTANLTHPHILPLHDSGEADSFLYYVMPYVEGESLRDRLERERQLSVDEAVEIATEVADALDYAHRNGVVHRDVKPANILLHEGRPMVADFGIALALSQAGGGRITETGLSLGTPHYMSPEQASGERTLDLRSDVYALGCILYEMLTGEPPYGGPTAQAVLARILTEEPRRVTDLRQTVPPHVAAVVAKALEKLPADRFHSARELVDALENPGFTYERRGRAGAPGATERATATAAGAPRPALWRVSLAANLILGATAVAALAAIFTGGSDQPVPSRWPTVVPLGINPSIMSSAPTVSPDGRLVAWTVSSEGIWVRTLDRLEGRLLAGTAGGEFPFVSPDGSRIGYSQGDALKVAALAGGPPLTLADGARLGSWSDDGWIHFVQSGTDALARVPEAGGDVEVVVRPDTAAGDRFFGWPRPLPGGRAVLATLTNGDQESQVVAVDVDAGAIHRLTPGDLPRWDPTTKHLVFLRGTAVMAAPLDPGALELKGAPFPITENVGWFDLSLEGTLLYIGGALFDTRPAVADRSGVVRPLPNLEEGGRYLRSGPRVSPDGGQIAVYYQGEGAAEGDVWIYTLPEGPMTRLTFDGGQPRAWTRDGEAILFTREDGLYRVPADGSRPPERVLGNAGAIGVLETTPDDGVVFETRRESWDILTAPLNGSDSVVALLETDFSESDPTLSPDGRWLVYESEESGRDEVFARRFPGPGGRQQLSVGGGENPEWSRSGREIFFTNAGGWIEALEVSTNPTFRVVSRTPLFAAGRFFIEFDPFPGDSLFAVLDFGGAGEDQSLIVTRNWNRLLLERAEGGR